MIPTTLCYIEKDDSYLMLHRVSKEVDINKGKWIGVGGKFEDKESPEECLLREVKEETGLTVLRPQLCGVKQFPIENGRYLVFLFKTDQFEGEVVSSEEGNMEWVDREKLAACQTVEDFDQLLNVMEDDKLTDFQYIVDGEDWKVRIR